MRRPTLGHILRQTGYDTDKSDEFLRNYERAWITCATRPSSLEVSVNKGGSYSCETICPR
jgi:hypothetical protein